MQPPKITQCHIPTTALHAVAHCTRHLGSICVIVLLCRYRIDYISSISCVRLRLNSCINNG